VSLVWRTSLLSGWLLPTVSLLALAVLTAGIAWWRRTAWTWAALGMAALLAAALIARTAAPPSAVGGSYPRSFVVWGALPLFALAAAIWQWRVVRWWRRGVALLAVPFLAAFAGLQINAHYGYLPTVGDLVGVPLPGEVASLGFVPAHGAWVPAAAAVRVRSDMGVVTQIDIPGRVSHFHARAAWVWLPPAYFTGPDRALPVVMLLAGVPGATRDWLRGAFAARTADAWSRAHDGLAPILVFPDPNGSALADTECVDGPQGNSETYLTVDVPAFMHEYFHTPTGAASWAVGGLSEGATCALMLGARHPDKFSIFADFSGGKAPSSGNPKQTLERLYGGDRNAMRAHDPARWFALDARLGEQGVVIAGGDDAGALAAQAKLVADARAVGFPLRTDLIPGGGHNFQTWGRALQDTFPWIATTLERSFHGSDHDVRA
jgi:S-formylglutathione hydrolase FrmB